MTGTLLVKQLNGRTYVFHAKTNRFWKAHFAAPASATILINNLYDAWHTDPKEQYHDLAANFVDGIDDTVPAANND